MPSGRYLVITTIPRTCEDILFTLGRPLDVGSLPSRQFISLANAAKSSPLFEARLSALCANTLLFLFATRGAVFMTIRLS